MNLRHAAATDIGGRKANEDAYLMAAPLFAVADGMGGHSAGDVASKTALDVLAREVSEGSDALLAGLRAANLEVHRQSTADPRLAGMGTTLTAMLADAGGAQIAHVGDSRAYLLREGRLQRLTRDHTVAERLARQGKIRSEDADRHPQRSVLERAVGVDSHVEVDVQVIDVRPGDRFLLCTDGLTGTLADDEIFEILAAEPDAEKAARQLVEEAVQAGTSDNVTALVVDYPVDEPVATPTPRLAPRRRKRRLVAWLGLGLAVAVVAAVAGVRMLGNAWYVGDHQGRVAVFRGVPGSVAGIRLSTLERRTDLRTSSLTPVYQRRIREGIAAADRSAAEEIVRDIRGLVEAPASLVPPSPTPLPYQP